MIQSAMFRRRPTPIVPDTYWVTERIAAGGYPGARDPDAAREKIATFEAARIRHFVDLTHLADGLEPYDAHLQMARRLRHPIVDMDVPAEREMVATLDAIDAALAARGKVYVHCWGGIGRTGTVIGCWLVRHGSSPEKAIGRIRRLRQPLPIFERYPTRRRPPASTRWCAAGCGGCRPSSRPGGRCLLRTPSASANCQIGKQSLPWSHDHRQRDHRDADHVHLRLRPPGRRVPRPVAAPGLGHARGAPGPWRGPRCCPLLPVAAPGRGRSTTCSTPPPRGSALPRADARAACRGRGDRRRARPR